MDTMAIGFEFVCDREPHRPVRLIAQYREPYSGRSGDTAFQRAFFSPGSSNAYAYDARGQVTNAVMAVSSDSYAYVWGPDLSGTMQGAGGVGGLLAVSVDGDYYFPFYDNNGNVMGYADENRSCVARYDYDAFGNLVASSGPMADFFPHRFSTKYLDPDLGLYYYGYRWYSPELGRWISRDPIGEEGGENLYGFCGNFILHLFDPLGLTSVIDVLIAYFSPFGQSKLWVMPESDSYTDIVRKWAPVIEAIQEFKQQISVSPDQWFSQHSKSPNWRQERNENHDPRSVLKNVKDPPGTDPTTVIQEFKQYCCPTAYMLSVGFPSGGFFSVGMIMELSKGLFVSDDLATGAIGSFRIGATGVEWDCPGKRMSLDVWMANTMDRQSFGTRASDLLFSLSAQQPQHMWWNWKEELLFDE